MRRMCLAILLSFIASGCTFADVKPGLNLAPPTTPPKTLIIGDIVVADPLWESYRLYFRRGVEEWLHRNGGFETVAAERPTPLPAASIVLAGTITEMDKGSWAFRFFVGMGAGQARVKGDFEIQDPTGAVLAKFAAQESYLGGAGMGGAGMLDMEDLVRRFAETVAETTRNWARGEKIEER
jgi:hypothetical protein